MSSGARAEDFLHDVGPIHYLDNAATVYPKPREILDRMLEIYRSFGVNPGRSGYDLCLVGGDMVNGTRARLCQFFGARYPERLCFTNNASDSLNILLQGMLEPGDHVIATSVEHNSVIRPLNHLAREGLITVDYLPSATCGRVDPDDVRRKIRPSTRLVALNHGSNVIGTIQPVAEIGRICRENDLLFVVDVAQTAGIVPIDVEDMHIDGLAFTGHKSLLGPTGIGGLYVRDGVSVHPTRYGGTGVRSAHPFQLDEYPYRLEIGTPNVLGIAGLYVAQDYLAERGLDQIHRGEMELFSRLQSGLAEIEGVRLHGTTSLENRLPVLSLTVEAMDPADVGTFLDVDYSVACRTGLQCAPLIHDEIGTSPRGTVRLSLGPMNTSEDIDVALWAMEEIATHALQKNA
jgi:cysteine desulfurase family protein